MVELLLDYSAVGVIQAVEDVFIKSIVTSSDHFPFTRDPYAGDVSEVISHQITNVGARLKLWNVIPPRIDSTAIDMKVIECWLGPVQGFERRDTSSK